MADCVMGTVQGCLAAQRVINTVRQGCAPADALLEALQAVQATGEPERVRGFVREVQKAVERT